LKHERNRHQEKLGDPLMTSQLLVICALCFAWGPEDQKQIVVYTALDRQYSEQILENFKEQTGLKVLPVYDTESTKTVGLVNRIRTEKNRPRCDVFWNNEIVNTLRLKEEGLLQPCHPTEAINYSRTFQDLEGYWFGFAARARVLIVNTELVAPGEEPQSIFDLTKPEWKGKIGIAKPLFGTTASHMACLFSELGEEKASQWLSNLKSNDVRIMSGNRACAQAVAKGHLQCGLTDTDDAIVEIRSGKPVRIVYLDSQPNQLGTLFLPNTLSVIKGCPNPSGAKRLINYLLSVEVEEILADGPSAQIPLNMNFNGKVQVKTPQEIKEMEVDFGQAAKHFQKAAKYIEEKFLD